MAKKIIEKSPYLILDKNREFIHRVFSDEEAYQREVIALLDCSDKQVQQIISYNDSKKIIKVRYYSHMLPFTVLKDKELDFFIFSLLAIINIIQHCHQCGWVHGDIKPSNFLYNKKHKEFKLIDFSAALPIGFPRTKLNCWQYTQFYASFNQQAGIASVKEEDDWFSLARWLSKIDLKQCNKSEMDKVNKIKNRLSELTDFMF